MAVIAGVLFILGSTSAMWQINKVYAKSKVSTQTVDAKTVMSKYTPLKSTNKVCSPGTSIRKSRLSEMNIVSEAAQVLNVLPINIIQEMKKGKTLVQLAKEKGLTKNQFMKKLGDVEDKKVKTAAKNGVITDDHAEALKEGQKERLDKSVMMKSVNVNDHMAMDMGN